MSLNLNLDAQALGQCLTVAQKIAIRNALTKIKLQEKLDDIRFWGKINGAQSDYFIAVSTSITNTIAKSFYWSNDEGATFAQLPAPDEFVSAKAPKLRGAMLSGNPALKHKDPDAPPKVDEDGQPIEEDSDEEEEEEEEEPPVDEDEVDEDGNPIVRPPPPRRLTELERLSFAVRQIDSNTSLVPRGSIYMTATGELVPNTSFSGLSLEQARSLSSFQLLRPPQNAATLAAIRRAGVTNHHDCLDALAPAHSAAAGGSSKPSALEQWSLQVSESGLEVSLRSLLFPGFEFRLQAGSAQQHSGAYFGLGHKNEDLLFMI